MSGDPMLSVFPAPLLRLILCGGEGLSVAYGPLRFMDPHYLDRKEQGATWSGSEQLAYFSDVDDCAAWGMDAFESARMEWRLPLDHWRPRLALVAAWMLGWHKVIAADVQADRGGVALRGWSRTSDAIWVRRLGPTGIASPAGDNLPTITYHLLTHDPAVALLLAIWDATEGRDR